MNQSLVDQLMDRWEELSEQGCALAAEELCADHPEVLEEVRWQILALNAIHSHFGFASQDSPAEPTDHNSQFQPPSELQIIASFRLERAYAVGGLGQVFIAQDETLNRKVAIKFPKRQGMTTEQLSRFEQEARITGQLEHPGIVPVHALDISNAGEPCYVMRFVDGETLQQSVATFWNNQGSNFDRHDFESDGLRHLLQTFVAVCNIVAYAHGQEVLHRDIKPNNILLGPFGETLLLDWGIAKHMPEQSETIRLAHHDNRVEEQYNNASPVHTAQGRALGTPAYASPEQTLGQCVQVGFASDIYSLGATLFYILTGKAPLEAAGWSTYLESIRSVDAKLVDYLPHATPVGLREICNKTLQIDPTRRYQSPLELAADIDRFLAREPLSVLPESWWTKLARWARKRPTLSGAVVASGLVCVIAAAATSAIVNRKNQELSEGNRVLQGALSSVEEANRVALSALRGMVDEVVTLKFAEGDHLSENERSYIQSILQQYSKLSELQESSEQAQALQAEAFLQIGMMYYRLDQFEEALPALQSAMKFLGELHAQSSSPKYLPDLSTACVNVATIEIELGDPNACLITTATATKLIADAQSGLDAETAYLIEGDRASLHRMRAEAFEVKNESSQAVRELQSAIAILERMLAESPSDSSVQFAIGQVCRMMGSALNSIADNSLDSLKQAQQYADRAISTLAQLSSAFPDKPRYEMALVWAHFDRAEVLKAMGANQSAITDLNDSFDAATNLALRFPLISVYRECLPLILMRRGSLHWNQGNVTAADSDFSNAEAHFIEMVAARPNDKSLLKQLIQSQSERAKVQLSRQH